MISSLKRQCTLFSILGIGLAISVLGCGDGSRKPVFPVSGKLLYRGKPLPNATLVFHPVDESGTEVAKPRGKTDAEGVFKLTTYDGNDGAPVGEYRVTAELWMTTGQDAGPTNRIPPKFGKPETSGLTVSIKPAPNELEPITLK